MAHRFTVSSSISAWSFFYAPFAWLIVGKTFSLDTPTFLRSQSRFVIEAEFLFKFFQMFRGCYNFRLIRRVEGTRFRPQA